MPSGARLLTRMWVLTLLLAAVAFGLGYAGFDGYLRGQPDFADTGVLDRVYYTLQLFVLDPTPFGTGPYSAPLDWARFLAPLTTVLALIQAVAQLFGDWLRTWQFRRAPAHVVVIGDGPAPVALAKRLVGPSRKDPKVVYVGSGVPPEHARRHGLLVVQGTGTDEVTLGAAGVGSAGTVYVMTPVGATNAAVAMAVRKLARGPVEIFLQIHDEDLVTALRARRTNLATVDLEFFVLEAVAARVLLDRFRPVDDAGRPRPVVISGFGAFPEAVLGELLRRWRQVAHPCSVTLVTKRPAAVQEFLARHRRADAHVTVDITDVMPASAGAALVYACQVDADEVLRTGLSLVLAGAGTAVLCLGRRAELGGALDGQQIFDNADGKLEVFGILDEAFADGAIKLDLVDRLGRALHARYLAGRLCDGESLRSRPAVVAWHDLPESFREDNRRQAEHIRVMLAGIHARLVPEGPGFAPFGYAGGEVDALARLEHQHWWDAKIAAGDVHEDMKPWDELDPKAQGKNIDSVETMPEAVRDAGFQIVRDAQPP